MYDIDISYIRRPLLARGHQAARRMFHTPFTFTFTCYIYILWSCMTLFHAVCCILYAVSTQLSVVVCPGNQTVTLPWLGCLDSGCLWWDPGIHWNSKQSPIPPKIIKMDPWDLQKTAKCCPEWSLKPSKSWKHWKCGISWKPLYLIYFWEVGTLENHSFSIQKSSKNMPANHVFHPPNLRIYQKVTQNGLQLGTHNPSKIVTNLPWDPQVTPWVHPCPTWSPKC